MTRASRWVWWLAVWGAFYLTLTLAGSASAAEILWGLTADHTLVRFSSTAPGTTLTTLAITGLPEGERIVAIDVERSAGRFFGVSNAGRLYEINRTTGAAVLVNPKTPVTALPGAAVGMADHGPSLIVLSDTGGVVFIDKYDGEQYRLPALAGRRFVALAWRYTNESYRVAIDSATDTHHVLTEPQSGGLSVTVFNSPLGVDTSDEAGLEFGPHDGVLYAALTVGGTPSLYTIPHFGSNAVLGSSRRSRWWRIPPTPRPRSR